MKNMCLYIQCEMPGWYLLVQGVAGIKEMKGTQSHCPQQEKIFVIDTLEAYIIYS